jgi:hypothetical protein
MEDELGQACGMNGAKVIYYWWESQKERDYYEDYDIGGWIMF